MTSKFLLDQALRLAIPFIVRSALAFGLGVAVYHEAGPFTAIAFTFLALWSTWHDVQHAIDRIRMSLFGPLRLEGLKKAEKERVNALRERNLTPKG